MRTISLVFLLLIGLILSSAPNAAAQDVNSLDVTAVYTGEQVLVTIDMDIITELPADWVGWIVERSVYGECAETAEVTSVIPFPSGPAQFTLFNIPSRPDLLQKYRVKAVDEAGARHYLSLPLFPPGYYSFGYALRPNTPLARGTITDLGWTLGIDTCPGLCWEWVSFLSGDVTGLDELVGTGAVVELYGQIDCNFEGPYVTVESWALETDCGTVGNESASWGEVKSRWR